MHYTIGNEMRVSGVPDNFSFHSFEVGGVLFTCEKQRKNIIIEDMTPYEGNKNVCC